MTQSACLIGVQPVMNTTMYRVAFLSSACVHGYDDKQMCCLVWHVREPVMCQCCWIKGCATQPASLWRKNAAMYTSRCTSTIAFTNDSQWGGRCTALPHSGMKEGGVVCKGTKIQSYSSSSTLGCLSAQSADSAAKTNVRVSSAIRSKK